MIWWRLYNIIWYITNWLKGRPNSQLQRINAYQSETITVYMCIYVYSIYIIYIYTCNVCVCGGKHISIDLLRNQLKTEECDRLGDTQDADVEFQFHLQLQLFDRRPRQRQRQRWRRRWQRTIACHCVAALIIELEFITHTARNKGENQRLFAR